MSESDLIQRFMRLKSESGISDFMDKYIAEGYRIEIAGHGWPHKGTVNDPWKRHLVFNFSDLETTKAPEATAFAVIILHEFGHYEAVQRGLDGHDELLAWEIAAELCPFDKLPDEWEDLKKYALSTRTPRQLGELLENTAIRKLIVLSQCPDCGFNRLATRPDQFKIGPNNPGKKTLVCGSDKCGSQFLVEWSPGGIVKSAHRWVLPPDSQ